MSSTTASSPSGPLRSSSSSPSPSSTPSPPPPTQPQSSPPPPTQPQSSTLKNLYIQFSSPHHDTPYLLLLLLFETLLSILILTYIPYTEIDWQAYMSEVSTYLNGERNYIHIKGGTGPLVYPAGFLYLYSFFRFFTNSGTDIYKAQLIFVLLYLLNTAIVLYLYTIVSRRMTTLVSEILTDAPIQSVSTTPSQHPLILAHVTWTWRIAMALCCASKRIHSIFILRLFNDGPAMILLYISILCFIQNKWRVGCIFYSLGVSIKMNVLLFAPGLLLLLLQSCPDLVEVGVCLSICAAVQLGVGAPFLLTFPVSYLRKAFELDRVFFYRWTVNWKFLPEDIFTSKPLSFALLFMHIEFLIVFAIKWLRSAKEQTGSYLFLCHDDDDDTTTTTKNNNSTTTTTKSKRQKHHLTPEYIIQTLFLSNFIGIIFARTLHYQFYSWYFHTIPFMLMFTLMKKPIKLCIVGMIEYAFNVFPATACSSAVLQVAHFGLLCGIIMAGVPQILYVKSGGGGVGGGSSSSSSVKQD